MHYGDSSALRSENIARAWRAFIWETSDWAATNWTLFNCKKAHSVYEGTRTNLNIINLGCPTKKFESRVNADNECISVMRIPLSLSDIV